MYLPIWLCKSRKFLFSQMIQKLVLYFNRNFFFTYTINTVPNNLALYRFYNKYYFNFYFIHSILKYIISILFWSTSNEWMNVIQELFIWSWKIYALVGVVTLRFLQGVISFELCACAFFWMKKILFRSFLFKFQRNLYVSRMNIAWRILVKCFASVIIIFFLSQETFDDFFFKFCLIIVITL